MDRDTAEALKALQAAVLMLAQQIDEIREATGLNGPQSPTDHHTSPES